MTKNTEKYRNWILPRLLVAAAVVLSVLLFQFALAPLSAQQEEAASAAVADEEPDRAGRDEEEVGPERLERRLDEIEELLERAEREGDEGRIRELRREGERILDRLEELERSREGEEEFDEEAEELERFQRELQVHRLELEIRRLEMEVEMMQLETAVRLAQLAENELTSASYAITQLVNTSEPEEAADALALALDETRNPQVRRMLRHKLAQLQFHLDRPADGKRQLRSLLLGE